MHLVRPLEPHGKTDNMTSTLDVLPASAHARRIPMSAHASRKGVLIWPRPHLTHGTVLIIEDDERLMTAMSRRIQRAGIDVLAATEGTGGLRKALTEPADAVLLDLGLPGMRGFKLLHELRARKPDLPVVIITGDLSPEIDRRGRDYGVVAVFRKPFSTARLIRTLQTLL